MPMYVKFLLDQERYGELSLDLIDLSYIQQAVKRETENNASNHVRCPPKFIKQIILLIRTSDRHKNYLHQTTLPNRPVYQGLLFLVMLFANSYDGSSFRHMYKLNSFIEDVHIFLVRRTQIFDPICKELSKLCGVQNKVVEICQLLC